jgi:hypothetical protein
VESLKSYLAVSHNTGQAVEISCPRAGIGKEVTCGAGRLTFNRVGFWHDGLKATDAVQVQWAHRRDYTVDRQTVFYPCPCTDCCNVNGALGNLSCTKGTLGVLCGGCRTGFYRSLDRSCASCEKAAPLQFALLAMFALAMACFLLTWWLRKIMAHSSKAEELYKAFLVKWTKWKDSVIVVGKLLFGFFQVVMLLRSVYRIPFPRLYVDVLHFFAFVNFDFVFFFRMECFMKTNWHTRVYIMGLVGICCLVGTASVSSSRALKKCTRRTSSKPWLIAQQWGRRVGNALFVLGYFIYASANTIFFQTFNCQRIDSTSLLRNDLTIDCSDPAHKSASLFAGFMVLTFSCGLPAMYLLLLFPHRKGFAGLSGRSQVALSDIKLLRFFYADYKVSIGRALYTL